LDNVQYVLYWVPIWGLAIGNSKSYLGFCISI
jgi:hypothetical protein